jgi:WD40 repeat protein
MHLTKVHFHTALLVTFSLATSLGLSGQQGRKPPQRGSLPAKGEEPLPKGALARMGDHRFWHAGNATALALSGDGARLALLDDEGTVHLWDAATGREVERIPEVGRKVLPPGGGLGALEPTTIPRLRFSPDGKLLAVGDGATLVHLWDLGTKKQRFQISGGEKGITRFAFSPDGKTLATVGGDPVVKLWSVETGKPTGQLTGHEGLITDLDYSADGRTLVTGSDDQSVRLWDVASGKERRQLVGHRHRVTEVALSRDGKQVASSALDGTIRLWEASTGKEVQHWPGSASGLGFSADGSVLAVVGDGGDSMLFEVATGRVLGAPADFSNLGMGLAVYAFSADGEYLVTWKPGVLDPTMSKISGGRIRRTRLSGRKGVARRDEQVSGQESVKVLAWSPDGKVLASAGPGRQVSLWEASTGKWLRQCRGHTGSVVALAFHPDPKRNLLASAAGSQDRTVSLWDVTTGKEVLRLRGKDDRRSQAPLPFATAWGLKFSPDGNLLACHRQFQDSFGSAVSVLWVWDVRTGKLVTLPGPHTASAFTADGQTLLALGYENPGAGGLGFGFAPAPAAPQVTPLFRRWQVGTWKETIEKAPWLTSPGNPGAIGLDPLLSSNGRVLAQLEYNGGGLAGIAGGIGGTLRLWDVQRGKPLHQVGKELGTRQPLGGQFGGLNRGGFGGGALGLGSGFGGITGGPPQYVSFSPDGKAVAACRLDGRIHVWEVASGGERCQLVGNPHGICSLCFAPDGKRLASGSPDGTLLIWDVTGMNGADQGAEPLTDKALATLWADLKEKDATRAYRAICRLQNAPDRAVPFFTAHFEPARGPDPAEVGKLIANLDSDRFAVRQAAEDKLRALGEQARPALEKTLANKSSLPLGVRRTIENLLKRGESRTPEQLRQTRAIEVLEGIGTPESVRLLERLAGGAPGMHLTRLAQESLMRLKPRFAKGP